MSKEPDHSPTRDEQLTAFLDGEAGGAESAAIETRLEADAELRERLELLRAGRPPAAPFDLLLDMAPVGRLEAMLDAAERPSVRAWGSFAGVRALAAAIVLLVLGGAIGFALSRSLAPVEVAVAPGWREVVADYVALYTPETFALAPADPEAYAPRLAIVGEGLGLDLAPATVALPGLDLKGALLFHFDGKPLGQVSYLSTEFGPVAFCIIKNGREDAPLAFEERRGMNVAFWNAGGRGYLIIGAMPKETLAPLAETLASRMS